ncbi:MAG: hypothetical protein JXR76_11535 [Deltaproteobacteria bacterium]|nr:hypothetical protein [Deltaproteobacteria bacterium]
MKHKITILISGIILFLQGAGVHAETVIDIDGSLSDWDASDAQCMLNQTDPQGSDFVDVVQICVTDSFSSDGYFYLLMEFVWDKPSSSLNRIWLQNADVILSVDTNSDGVFDTEIDFVNDPAEDVYGILSFPYLELRIDYDLVDPDGDREFSFFIDTYWRSSIQDRVPLEDGSSVDYSVDPVTGSPRSVRMLAQSALAGDEGVTVSWVTASERANAGFHVYRYDASMQRWTRLTDQLIPGLGDAPFGRQYSYVDSQGLPGDVYLIQDVEFSGKRRGNGKFVARVATDLVDEYLPPMVSKTERPFNFANRIQKAFEKLRIASTPRGASETFLFQLDEKGLYQISGDTLRSLNYNPQRTGLSINGKRIPDFFVDDKLFFYDAPIADRYADYDTVVAAEGRRSPMSMKRALIRNRCDSHVTSLPYTETFENDVNYYVATPTDDPFFWTMVFGSAPATIPIQLTDVVSGPGKLTVSLVGFATVADGDDHIASFILNGQPLGEWRWNGKNVATAEFDVPEGILRAENELVVEMSKERGADMLSIDKVTLTYARRLALNGGMLEFTASPGSCVSILVNATDVVVLDVTAPSSPVKLEGAVSDGRQLLFGVPRGRDGKKMRTLLVANSDQALTPVPERHGMPTQRLKNAVGAQYIVVTHPLFADAAAQLAQYHSQVMSTFVVTTEELYDKYNGGRPHPGAIRQFLLDVANADRSALQYVLLLGSATVDSNDVMGIGDEDYVPTYYYRTNLMGYEAAADTVFVAGLSDVALGRLAVRNINEANVVVDKLISWYETDAPAKANSVFIADREDGSGRSFVDDMNAQIAAGGPFSDHAERIVLDDVQRPSDALYSLLQKGADFLNYHGHAYVSGWSSPEIANLGVANRLQNSHLFFVMSWSCFDGMFSGPWDEALAWQFVANPSAGAFGALAGSSLSDPAFVEEFALMVTKELASGVPTMGEAVVIARRQMAQHLSKGAMDTIYTYNLLADPAAPNPWY